MIIGLIQFKKFYHDYKNVLHNIVQWKLPIIVLLRTTKLLSTYLTRKIMACFIMTGEIMGGKKYGGFSPKTANFSRSEFYLRLLLRKILSKFQENLLVSFCPRCTFQHYDQWWYLSFHSQTE